MIDAVLDAMLTALQARTWETVTPGKFVKGPIPPLVMFPILGVMTPGGDIEARVDLMAGRNVDRVGWTVAIPCALEDSATTYEKLLGLVGEMRRFASAQMAYGLDGLEDSRPVSWSTALAYEEDARRWIQTATLILEVRYREEQGD